MIKNTTAIRMNGSFLYKKPSMMLGIWTVKCPYHLAFNNKHFRVSEVARTRLEDRSSGHFKNTLSGTILHVLKYVKYYFLITNEFMVIAPLSSVLYVKSATYAL
jgi:hypothetical protein